MPPRVDKKPLEVRSSIFGKRTYRDRKGKTITILYYEEAREYAAKNGYKGIKIQYV